MKGRSSPGRYMWRTFENTKRRPNYVVAYKNTIEGAGDASADASAEGRAAATT